MSVWGVSVLLVILVPVVFVAVGVFISWWGGKVGFDSESHSGFECGFSSLSSKVRGFSIYFFYLSVLFLVFDAELLVLLPLPELGSVSGGVGLVVFVFVIGLVLGLYHEWREGALERVGW